MSTLFTRIIQGEIPCAKLYEDDQFIAFLDVRPIRPGHALVVPKPEVDYIFNLPEDLRDALLKTAQPIAKAIEQVVPCKRIGLMVAGLEVPHCHLHLVPIDDVGDLNFANGKAADPEELHQLAEQIQKVLKN